MQNIDALIHARWIIPVEPEGAVHEDHSLAVHDGRIVAVLPRAEAEARFQADAVHALDEHVLIPGLVNAHTHAAMTLLRGLADDLPLMEWLKEHVWPAEQKWVNEEFVHDGTLVAAAEMLRGGTTCFNDMYFFPEVTARVASSCGLRAVVGLIVVEFPSAWAGDADEYLDKGLAVHDQYHGDPLIRTAFAPHAPYTVSDGPLRRIQVYVEELDIPVHMHVHETRDEVEGAVAETGVRPLARLDELGLVSPYLLAVHATQLDEAEIGLLADRGAHVVHCPESNLKLASGLCRVQRLQGAGVNVALGTDGAASNNDLDMLGEMRSAALLGKAVANDAGAVPAHVGLRMATLNGARALGMDEVTGSLVPGKAADVVAVSLGDIETQPVYHPLSQLVYATGRDKVTDVWVNGRHLLNDRVLTTIDEAEVLRAAREWRARIEQYA
ncbi:MAG: TRZ/ATZ family hydrolase [Gammaproteobacteria bacterium]|nr:TRZ/ATZ family hydrolase [Gammaproteobacteria bacterium]NIR96558.1 TRZ/ATZ family hydrolase [Gammaproteobacteria bacterium]NIT62296.1 TRZ/ATZ family hydrolase [Gammaproteobacteria bacterium]NIV19200.1 TRZ/ATZ family hydrolase [Gammaproteobacteria bacterium]NIX10068.1 TRZ/ATZ family hydrolase [Gammaproteobacteria bacterium]